MRGSPESNPLAAHLQFERMKAPSGERSPIAGSPLRIWFGRNQDVSPSHQIPRSNARGKALQGKAREVPDASFGLLVVVHFNLNDVDRKRAGR